MTKFRGTTLILAAAVTAASFLTACGSGDSATTSADALVVSDAWVKAADEGMTGAFAELENTGGSDLHIVAVSSPSADRAELHEMAPAEGSAMVMREMADGLVVGAESTHTLAPGGDHLMLMDILEPITPGSDVTFTLEFEDGSTKDFTAQVRDFAGAQEEYEPATEGSGHGG
ncbi:copper chaperone PCu(A)C [Rhodococcus coprophilus]|uniref:Lipoprotein n=1 Tax=Rhodococcus coprophilus TaxID=38310 RepID=A0A2X4XAG9_9NOCA|nr:copper chaperone PCu(A)C [Rhodococcus coprophilus]MBM7458805.1 copper(I)-binding protein [Rhodococcus coprophilus]SQI33544.1 lipoprotein [Rhodococcus coprophilus]